MLNSFLPAQEKQGPFYRLILLTVFLFSAIAMYAQTGIIKGSVITQDGPLAGASVTAGSAATVTDRDGKFLLQLPSGLAHVAVTAAGYEAVTSTVNVITADTTTLDFSLVANTTLDEVVVIGSRSLPRTQLTSAVPVDVIDVGRLAEIGPQVTLNQILSYAAPSFTSNTQSLADGADHVDPASLRGLGPDQVLVLINGKRRHSSALVNVIDAFGRGSVGTDLNAIPVSAIERVEILRDGASAQYGSDAIAGVINIILRKSVNTMTATVTAGQHNSKSAGMKYRDGQSVQLALNYGLPVGQRGGFINFSGSYDHREPTNRTAEFKWPIYQSQPGGPDRTDSFLQATNTTRRDYSLVLGQSKLSSGQFFYNTSVPLSANAEFYSFGGFGYRHGLSAGINRFPNDARNVLTIYPTGFRPYISSDIYDKSASAGIRSQLKGWNIDFSNTYGQNQFIFGAQNTLNASMLNASPVSFNSGGPRFIQNTINTDLSKNLEWLHGVNIAFGSEYRFERYQLIPGEESSYTNYGTATQIGVDGAGNAILLPDPKGSVNTLFGPDGTPRQGGAQGFPGFRPENAVDATRNALATYTDVEVNFSGSLMADAAIRYENYSDFGAATNGKLAIRYKAGGKFVLRASGSTGFRAPSLQQRYYANTATVFTDGILSDVGVFPNNSRAAKLVGIPDLVPEKSKSLSAGFTGNFGNIKFTVDGYLIHIDNRIVFTDEFSGSNAPGAPAADKELYEILMLASATKAQFFANAINTQTKGIDLIVSYSKRIGGGMLAADLAATASKTTQVGDIRTSEVLKGKENIYFSEKNRVYLENAIPNEKVVFSLNYNVARFNIFFRNNYFGGVTEPVNIKANQQFFNPRIITDLSLGYKLTREIKISAGANNLLDVYPEKISIDDNSGGGQAIYSRGAMQFGFGGRYLFGRIEVTL